MHWYASLMLAQVQELAYQGMAQVVLAGAGFGIGPGYGLVALVQQDESALITINRNVSS